MRYRSIQCRKKTYVDNLEAWKFLDLNLLRTSLDFSIDQKN